MSEFGTDDRCWRLSRLGGGSFPEVPSPQLPMSPLLTRRRLLSPLINIKQLSVTVSLLNYILFIYLNFKHYIFTYYTIINCSFI